MKEDFFAILNEKLNSYMKLTKDCNGSSVGVWWGWKTFNNISFMENKLWNQLTTHQMTCILLWLAKNNSCCRISLWWSNCIVKGIDLEVLGKCVIVICGAIYMLQKFVCEKWWFGCWIGIWMWGSWLLGARLPCCWSGQAVCGCIVGQFTIG